MLPIMLLPEDNSNSKKIIYAVIAFAVLLVGLIFGVDIQDILLNIVNKLFAV